MATSGALKRTLERRPDLLEAFPDAEDQKLLNSLRLEESHRE